MMRAAGGRRGAKPNKESIEERRVEWRVLAAIGSRDWLYPSGIFVTVTASGGGDGIGRAIQSKTKDVRHQPSTTKTKRD